MADNNKNLSKRLHSPGPKRILALDGGGIRGLVTLGLLARVEEILRERLGRPDLVLSEYFDLIGGTSTGSIIGTLLCMGWSVEEIRKMYLDLGEEAFQPRKSWFGPLGRVVGAKFDEKPFEALLKKHLGNRTLGSGDLRCGLVFITKRIDTGSVWVLFNVPEHPYYEMNKDLLLWELVRASTAAPTFFKPHMVENVGPGEDGIFVDGGISMHGNPALQMLMVATMKGYALDWPTGEKNLLICSLGTGELPSLLDKESVQKFSNLHWLAHLITQMMQDSSKNNQTILQWISKSPTAKTMDSQIGTLEKDCLCREPVITYLRYNPLFNKQSLSELGLNYTEKQVRSLRNMSDVRNIEQLDRIGTAAGEKLIEASHFAGDFDNVYEQ